VDRQRRAGFVMIVRPDRCDGHHRLRQEPAGGAVVVVMRRRRRTVMLVCRQVCGMAMVMMAAVGRIVGGHVMSMVVQ
jgi:hypothetical protein